MLKGVLWALNYFSRYNFFLACTNTMKKMNLLFLYFILFDFPTPALLCQGDKIVMRWAKMFCLRLETYLISILFIPWTRFEGAVESLLVVFDDDWRVFLVLEILVYMCICSQVLTMICYCVIEFLVGRKALKWYKLSRNISRI